MIKSLVLKNFQSHKSSTLVFNPGVNVIVGSTDSGKTAILRALRLLIENRPSGDEFLSTWGGIMELILETEEYYITRVKGKKDNAYFLDEQEFVAFGKGVPEEIVKALNINEINLQRQLDSPFLLTSSPGEVAAHFNKVARLDQIDESVHKINKWIRDIESKILHNTAQVESWDEKLKEYAYLEKFEAEVEVSEDMEKKRNKLASDKSTINIMLNTIEERTQQIEELDDILEDEELINEAIAIAEKIAEKETQLETLTVLCDNIEVLDYSIEQFEEVIQDEELINTAIDLNEEIKQKQAKWEKLHALMSRLGAMNISIAAYDDSVKRHQERFDKLFPDICPLCDKPK